MPLTDQITEIVPQVRTFISELPSKYLRDTYIWHMVLILRVREVVTHFI